MRSLWLPALALPLALAACVTALTDTSTTRAYLTPSESRVLVHEPPGAATRDVIRLFHERGAALVAQRGSGTARVLVLDRGHFGYLSQFTATVTAVPGGLSEVDLDGRALLEDYDTTPYTDTNLSAADEARDIHGVLSELVVEGKTVPAIATAAQPAGVPSDLDRCRATRAAALRKALANPDAQLRAYELDHAPDCDGAGGLILGQDS